MTIEDERLLVYGEYSKLIDNIKYFDDKQTQFRQLTSKALLGSFAIIGVLYFTKFNFDILASMIIAAIVPWLTIALISTYLIYDLALYERLRISCLYEAIQLEKKHSWLPPYHRNLIDESSGHHYGGGHKKINFYLGIVFILVVISILCIVAIPNIKIWITICSFLTGILIFFFYRKMALLCVSDTGTIFNKLKEFSK